MRSPVGECASCAQRGLLQTVQLGRTLRLCTDCWPPDPQTGQVVHRRVSRPATRPRVRQAA